MRRPTWGQLAGVPFLVGSVVLAARLIWEQTAWSWEHGPQNVGFALVHSGALVLILFPLLLVAWLVGVLVVHVALRRRPTTGTWVEAVAALAVLGLLKVPYGGWQRLFAGRIAAGPHAADFFVYDAASGDLAAVRALHAHGVPLDARAHGDRKTALHGAAVQGRLAVVEYLVARGADTNLLDRYGDSPAAAALESGHPAVAQFLAAHGGREVRGDPEQRRKATADVVREEVERMNRETGAAP